MNDFAFTPAEAAAVTGLSVKTINKAIENGLVPTRLQRSGRTRKRYLNRAGLVCLQLEARGMSILPLQVRKNVFQKVIQSPRQTVIRESEAVLIDVKAARQTLAASLSDLRKATQMVARDPDIMRGTPIVRGTRIPVHLIVEMLDTGANVQEILEGYPSLTRESIRLAQLYVKAFPKRGRPPRRSRVRGGTRSQKALNAVKLTA